MKKLLLALSLCILSATCAYAVPSRQEVLDAISVLENPTGGGDVSKAAQTVIMFASDSPDVIIPISKESAPWLLEDLGLPKEDTETIRSILLAQYVAGMIKHQLLSSTTDNNPFEGWLFVIRAYKQLQTGFAFSSPGI